MDILKSQALKIDFSPCADEYELNDTIGSGAYGVVCSAIHKHTKAKVAIKKISKISDHTEIARRTLRELKILRYFKHENVISIRKLMQHSKDGKIFDVYIVLDFMDTDLHNLIQSKQALSMEHIRYFLYQMLCGLKYIHSASVLHRDLKPSNILVNENCLLKIGDFGLARGLSNKNLVTDTTNFLMTQYVATRWYRAPELLLGTTHYTFSVDLWSVGCILAEMFRRKQLFPGRSFPEQLDKVLTTTGLPPESILKHAPANLQNFINDRYKNLKLKSLETEIPVIDPLAFDLLTKLLKSDPEERPTAIESLNHPFLSKLYSNDDPPCNPPFDFSFDKPTLTKEEMVNAIMSEVKSYEFKFNFTPNPLNCFKKPSVPKKAEVLERSSTTKLEPQVIEPTTQPSTSDIHMNSAGVGKKEEDINCFAATAAVDSKIALKKAILRKQKNKETVVVESDNPQKPMTAHRKMRERQMKREIRKNKNKKKLKDKHKTEKSAKSLLSDDDKKLLERWNAMQTRKNSDKSQSFDFPPDISAPDESIHSDIEELAVINNIPLAQNQPPDDKFSEIATQPQGEITADADTLDDQENIGLSNIYRSLSEEQLSILTRHLHMEDFNLMDTPKGTGDGYGIGLDLDALLNMVQSFTDSGNISPFRSIESEELGKILDDYK
ncbi:DgyrCDS9014 [Dimorphilus gyrociliatus]|uniref:DgyrCDS9014 n=1 Tax=Dimorphilus gyrociliatus TaxID=2664684 RepID=A0A7I8VY71_9ANNE|nr:DgyrCDS9014 [Dimorphilus gyrociliatus]